MLRPGRNEPCPCGSGKKYKKCCALKVTELAARYTMADRASLSSKLQQFGMRPAFEADFEIASKIFFAATEVGPEDLSGKARDEAANLFHCWYLYDMDLEEGHTIASMMLSEMESRLTPGERTYLRLVTQTALRFYRVIEVRPDEGITFEDVVSRERVDVRERLATRGLSKWDVLLTRVMPSGDGMSKVMDGGVMHFRAAEYRGIKSKLDYRRRQWREQGPGGDETAFYKRLAPVFFGLWADRFLPRATPELRNTDGEPLTATEIFYDVNDRDAVCAFFDEHAELEREGRDGDEPVWTWFKSKEASRLPGNTILGRIRLAGEGKLTIEVNSLERAERARKLMAGAGDAVSYHDMRSRDLADFLRNKRAVEAPLEAVPLDDELRARLQAYYDDYYREWLDKPVPLLEGHSPREAMAVKRLRPRVAELIRGLESDHERARRSGEVSHDPTWMWNELGLRLPK